MLHVGVDVGQQVLANGDVPVVVLLGVAFDAVVLADEGLQVESEVVVVLGPGGVHSD